MCKGGSPELSKVSGTYGNPVSVMVREPLSRRGEAAERSGFRPAGGAVTIASDKGEVLDTRAGRSEAEVCLPWYIEVRIHRLVDHDARTLTGFR